MSANYKGSITIFFTLTITLILSVLFSIIESARVTSAKVRCMSGAYLSLDSAFGHYARQIYDEYGLFLVFTSEEGFHKSLENYCKKNADPDTFASFNSFNLTDCTLKNLEFNNIYRITDNDGMLFAKQTAAYEKYRAVSSSITQISDIISDADSIDTDSSFTDDDVKNYISDGSNATGPYDSLNKDEAKKLSDDITTKTDAVLNSNLLLLFVDNPSKISTSSIDKEAFNNLPSHTCTLSDEAKAAQTDKSYENLNMSVDKVLFLSYLNNSFASYIKSDINADLPLRYQREYILTGCNCDNEALLKTAFSMVSLRACSNITYLLNDSDKRSLCFNLGKASSGGIPVLSTITGLSILSSWAYAEAVIDVRDLFAGKKVPFIKTNETWTLSLEGSLNLSKNTVSKNSGESGLTYDEYLTMCLYLSDPFTNYYRSMDLIQIDICHNFNADFLMNSCVVGANISTTYEADALFTNLLKVFSPDTYSFTFNTVFAYD